MLKKFLSTLALSLATMLSISSCSAKAAQQTNTDSKNDKTEINMEGKKLVAFFSHTGENYNVGNIEKGNTHIIADMIADRVGADRFEIVPVKPYPVDYNECIEVAREEKQANARPEVKGDVKVEDYDVIFLGYPNWWGEVPMCVYTFIEGHDWDGKTVIPFITHEGSGMGGTDLKISNACKGAEVIVGKGLAVQGRVAQEQQEKAEKIVDNWLKTFGL